MSAGKYWLLYCHGTGQRIPIVITNRGMPEDSNALLEYLKRFVELNVVSLSQTHWINVYGHVRLYS